MSSAGRPSFSPSVETMRVAIAEAKRARSSGDYAIGAAVVRDGTLIASSGNRVKLDNDPTMHAEVAAIRQACRVTGSRHLQNAILYTTAEPCPMCATAAIWARMAGIVSGSSIADMAEFRSASANDDWTWRTVDLTAEAILRNGDPKLFLLEGFLREECRLLFHDS